MMLPPAFGRITYKCKYPGCENAYYVKVRDDTFKNKHFHRFPRKEEFLEQWRIVCGIPDNTKCEGFRLCDDHFRDRDFLNQAKERLVWNAVPLRPDEVSGKCNSPNDIGANIKWTIDQSFASTNFEFLLEENYSSEQNTTDYLKTLGITESDFSERKKQMFQKHYSVITKLLKLKKLLSNEAQHLADIKALYEDNMFESINNDLNALTKAFMNSQLAVLTKTEVERQWTSQEQTFALSLHRRSPRLYKYLTLYFALPSSQFLKHVLSSVPFDAGLNEPLLIQLRARLMELHPLDRCCVLMFSELPLSSGLHYDAAKDQISGYVDLGPGKRTCITANRALVFMLKGIRRSWKQIIAYYISHDTISTEAMCDILQFVISQLQKEGFNILATVCNQGFTQRKALSTMCTRTNESDYYFKIKGHAIYIVYDVPNLLTNTRNAFTRCKIKYGESREANFQHLIDAYHFDQQQPLQILYTLEAADFNFANSYMKKKVVIAAKHLSRSSALAIQTYVNLKKLPSEALQTSAFLEKIDSLFDSLNSNNFEAPTGKELKCAVSRNSPHLVFWEKMLEEIEEWQLIDEQLNKNVTKAFHFVTGWKTTIRSMICIWQVVKDMGFSCLGLRSFNLDPIENLFSSIRQHGVKNNIPTCHQFTAALKAIASNNFDLPYETCVNSDRESENSPPLCDILAGVNDAVEIYYDNIISHEFKTEIAKFQTNDEIEGNADELRYVTDYLLGKIDFPINCNRCFGSSSLPSKKNNPDEEESDDDESDSNEMYEHILALVQNIHKNLYKFLEKNAHVDDIAETFKSMYLLSSNFKRKGCDHYDYDCHVLDKCVILLIYKFIKEQDRKHILHCDARVKRFKEA